jgi:hypothetical protein
MFTTRLAANAAGFPKTDLKPRRCLMEAGEHVVTLTRGGSPSRGLRYTTHLMPHFSALPSPIPPNTAPSGAMSCATA